MSLATKLFAALAGIIHVLFFVMESVLWLNPDVHSIFQVNSVADAETLNVYVKNQGYYNLFLAFGIFAGLVMLSRKPEVGRALVAYVCLFMIGAALVLRLTVPDMTLGPYIQGVAPAVALALMLLARNKQKST